MQLNILPKINSPSDLRKLKSVELNKLADELRHFTIETVTEIGGHLAPTLGVIELTVALHRVFNTPDDKIVWDVGHQGYAHKILTGRLDKFNTIRKMGGLSGFLKISESEYDAFGAGHASTSISAATGIAEAQKIPLSNLTVTNINSGIETSSITAKAYNRLNPDKIGYVNITEPKNNTQDYEFQTILNFPEFCAY